jgi:hypothetical protein
VLTEERRGLIRGMRGNWDENRGGRVEFKKQDPTPYSIFATFALYPSKKYLTHEGALAIL